MPLKHAYQVTPVGEPLRGGPLTLLDAKLAQRKAPVVGRPTERFIGERPTPPKQTARRNSP